MGINKRVFSFSCVFRFINYVPKICLLEKCLILTAECKKKETLVPTALTYGITF